MSTLADILIAQMASGEQPAGLRERLADLKQRYGTVTAASRAAGIDRRTWQRMESGRTHTPKPATIEKLGMAFRESQVKERNFGAGSIHFQLQYDGRPRALDASNLKLAAGTAEAMAAAYAAGDEEGVARRFIDGIGDDWYHDRIEDVYNELDGLDYEPGYSA